MHMKADEWSGKSEKCWKLKCRNLQQITHYNKHFYADTKYQGHKSVIQSQKDDDLGRDENYMLMSVDEKPKGGKRSIKLNSPNDQ